MLQSTRWTSQDCWPWWEWPAANVIRTPTRSTEDSKAVRDRGFSAAKPVLLYRCDCPSAATQISLSLQQRFQRLLGFHREMVGLLVRRIQP